MHVSATCPCESVCITIPDVTGMQAAAPHAHWLTLCILSPEEGSAQRGSSAEAEAPSSGQHDPLLDSAPPRSWRTAPLKITLLPLSGHGTLLPCRSRCCPFLVMARTPTRVMRALQVRGALPSCAARIPTRSMHALQVHGALPSCAARTPTGSAQTAVCTFT